MSLDEGMVEAAGVEPASEKDHRRKPTCLVRSSILTADWERTSRQRSSPIDLDTEAPGGSPNTYLAR